MPRTAFGLCLLISLSLIHCFNYFFPFIIQFNYFKFNENEYILRALSHWLTLTGFFSVAEKLPLLWSPFYVCSYFCCCWQWQPRVMPQSVSPSCTASALGQLWRVPSQLQSFSLHFPFIFVPFTVYPIWYIHWLALILFVLIVYYSITLIALRGIKFATQICAFSGSTEGRTGLELVWQRKMRFVSIDEIKSQS